MEVFTHKDKHFISINGKDYFLIRGYRKDYSSYILVQVCGRTPLRKEDLPSKDWEIVKSKVGSDRAWTAFCKRYFKYDTQKESPTLAFVGASTEGSFFIALQHIVKRFDLKVDDESLLELSKRYAADELSSSKLKRFEDHGNSGTDLVLVEFDSWFDREDAENLLKGES